jgi:hypothetical protein
MDSSQSSRTRAFLGLGGAAAIGAFWPGKDATHGEDQDVAVAEFLLEFASQAGLDFVEAGEDRDGDEDDDCAFAVTDFELEINVVLD